MKLAAPVVHTLLLAVLVGGSCATPVERSELSQEYFNLGNAYFELQDYERSFRYYQRAIALSDEIPAAGYNLARLHMERSENRAALDVLDRLLETDPSNTMVLETRAYLLFQMGRISIAREEYQSLLERPSPRHRIAYNLGLIEMSQERYDAAADVLEAHLASAEDDREYRWLLAEAYFRGDREDEALAELEQYRILAGTRAELLARLAVRYADWEYFLPSLEVFDMLEPDIPDDVDVFWAYARALLRGGDEFAPGRHAFERALQRGFSDAEAIDELLEHLREDEQEVLRELVELHQLDGTDDADDDQEDPEDPSEDETEDDAEV